MINICPKVRLFILYAYYTMVNAKQNFWKRTADEEYHYKVLLHELTHVLVFSDQLYPQLVVAIATGVKLTMVRQTSSTLHLFQ